MSEPIRPAFRESQVDDQTFIDDKWFQEKWPDEFRDDTFAIETEVGWFEILLHGEECRSYFLGGNSLDGDRIVTRGDMRHLLWVLHAELVP